MSVESPGPRTHPTPDADTYRRLRALFDAAIEQPEPLREAWIAAYVAEPDRDALRRLLAADATGGHLETPAGEIAARIGGDATAWANGLVGQRVGGFRLVRALGQGGMGAVFLGEREGADFQQLAAVKLLRRGLFSDVEHALFRRERRVLAMLSHPNITHLVDGGVTEGGIPYLVMEHVDGVPITQYASDHALDLRARLRLFLIVCRAAAAAHRQLIVHRDIKPSNILVTAAGEPKLLDFGIAKLLDDEGVDGTRTGFAALTREYAAPEQLAGDPVSTATDVYALGVLLHELLLGARPATPTQRPSSLALAGAQALRGDLDNVLLKAMDPEPLRRYGSAAELADDIERWLDARPVIAHPPSAWYRTRKFVRRHRGGVALTLAFLIAILVSLGVAAWQANEARAQAQVAREQARLAQRQAARANEVSAFLEALFQPFSEGTAAGAAPTLRQLLDRGRADISERYPEQPEVRADLLAMFARIDDTLGATASNRELAEAAARANEAAYGASDRRTLAARELHARVLRKLGDHAAAVTELESIRATMQANGIAGQDLARVLDGLALAQRQQGGDPVAAVAMQREALDLRLADPDASVDDRATGWNNLGSAQQAASQFADAAASLAQAYQLQREHAGDSVDTASILYNLGVVESQAGRWRSAAARFTEARAMFARIPIERHPSLVNVLLRECGVYIDLEELDRARAACRGAEAMTAAVHGEHGAPWLTLLLRRANLALATGDAAAARADFDRARALATSEPPIGDRATLLGVVAAWQARSRWLFEEHEAQRDGLLALLYPPDGSGQLGARSPGAFQFAAFAAVACRFAPGGECARDPAALARKLVTEPAAQDSALRLPAQLALAELALAEDRPQPAIAPLESLLTELDSELPPGHSWRAQALLTLAALKSQSGNTDGAYRDAMKGRQLLARLPVGHPLHAHRWLLERVPDS